MNCRVYRSEVPSFKEPVDEAALKWTLVGDHITAPEYTERVEQTFAHYYYKVTSVSPWGDLKSAAPYDSWQLGCSAKVSYSLDLWLVSVEGSVQASFDTRIG